MSSVSLLPITNLPEIKPGDNLIQLLAESDPKPQPGDIMVVTQKVVSKAEDRLVKLRDVEPTRRAHDIAQRWDKDPRLVELVLRESQALLRQERGVLISHTKHGFVCANAGIDMSNIDGGETACLLPEDCDRSAKVISQGLLNTLGFHVPVIVSDSFGRPWRMGITNVALGCFGMEVLLDHRGQPDSCGLEMKATVINLADALAASTELVTGKTLGYGATLIRGYTYTESQDSSIQASLRPWEDCFFT